MRPLLIYLAVGVACALANARFAFQPMDPIFWRDALLWPILLFSDALGLKIALPVQTQEWCTLGFGVLIVLYAVSSMMPARATKTRSSIPVRPTSRV